MKETDGILKGIRVLDMARFISGPFCAMMLADMGAEVIKVEKKGYGDDGRHIGPYCNGETLYFPSFNRNKKSVEVDFRDPGEVENLIELIKKSDVLIENFRPGTMEKMGLGVGRLRELNPRLIIASISGFGQSGPYRDRAAFDWIVQSMGGIMSVTGTPETGPLLAGLPLCDHLTAVYTAFGIMLAIYDRRSTGKGQFVDVALLDCVASILQTYIPGYSANGSVAKPVGSLDPLAAPVRRFKTKDGYIFVHAGMDGLFQMLKKAIDSPVLSQAEFEDSKYRISNRELLENEVEKWTSTKTSSEADDILVKAGVPCGIVSDMERVCNDPQILYRKAIVDVEVDNVGPVKFAGTAVKLPDLGSERIYNRAPRLGEHNQEVFGELCGIRLDIKKK